MRVTKGAEQVRMAFEWLTESCEQVTGTPNRSGGSSYRTKSAELMVMSHIAQNGSDTIVLDNNLPSLQNTIRRRRDSAPP